MNYRWTFYGIASIESQNIKANLKDKDSETKSKIFPKISGGMSIAF